MGLAGLAEGMLHVEGLTRRFGRLVAVNSLDFQLQEGEVVGLLGLNGAGKSTTMKLLAGILAPHEGTATFQGKSLFDSDGSLRNQVGYLPERPPLYPEMRVLDYLRFAARIRGGDAGQDPLRETLDQVGLAGFERRILGHLSKGYQQRVGLAQALVHNPKLLILDEPSSGLDPAQRLEIRELIAGLARGGRTLILSTHLLEEVEASCQRVLILHKGRLVADEPVHREEQLEVVVSESPVEAERVLKEQLPETVVVSEGHFLCPGAADAAALARLMAPYGLCRLAEAGGLQERFLSLTMRGEA